VSASGEAVERVVNDALAGYLDEGEIAIGWCVTIDVAGPDGARYLAHRAGGGIDGSERPTMWAVLGMLRANVVTTEQEIAERTQDVDDEPDDEDAG
jgi:hypothetical protein